VNKELTKEELSKVASLTEQLERETIDNVGYGDFSSVTATTQMFDYDDKYIDVELKWGVNYNTWKSQYKIDRTMPIEDWYLEDA
jgi:hypothetical protein